MRPVLLLMMTGCLARTPASKGDGDGLGEAEGCDAPAAWFPDRDGDGFGAADAEPVEACDAPTDHVSSATDCDDEDAAVHPGAPEVCDGADQDCDGLVDDGVLIEGFVDADGDGFGAEPTEACDGAPGVASVDGDCDDADAAVNPDAVEVCNERDDDCDGATDEDALPVAWYEDGDGDGYGAGAEVLACEAPSGHVEAAGDCDDGRPEVNPDATELCNGADDDCDGDVDEADAADAATWYEDADGDGFGGATTAVACDAPTGFSDLDTDCDDGDAAVNPDATELCNGADDDCDGDVDEGDAADAATWYEDLDGDGYGTGVTTVACDAPSGFVSADGDCDDADVAYNPGATPGCDGEDYDCDGLVDNDADLDGYTDAACGGTDCDDSDAAILPEASGACALGEDCLDILTAGRGSTDGVYTIDPDGYATGDDPVDVECDMTTDGGGWTGVADADFSVDSCLGTWVAGSGSCSRGSVSGSTSVSATIDSLGITYDEVAGAATMLQYGTPDAFHGSGDVTTTQSIEAVYVDGMSITHGAAGSRTHVFSYALGVSTATSGLSPYVCPSQGGISPSSVVGSDYLCGTGNSSASVLFQWFSTPVFASDDWQVTLPTSTSDDLEVRLMADQDSGDEEVHVSALELWVR